MNHASNRVHIEHIHIGFSGIVRNLNFGDCHQSLIPFGFKWGRGILIKGSGYLESVTGPYGTSHSMLKTEMEPNESSGGAYYYGYSMADKTLYLEYASDKNFDFHDSKVLNAIMTALKRGNGPLKDFILENDLKMVKPKE